MQFTLSFVEFRILIIRQIQLLKLEISHFASSVECEPITIFMWVSVKTMYDNLLQYNTHNNWKCYTKMCFAIKLIFVSILRHFGNVL